VRSQERVLFVLPNWLLNIRLSTFDINLPNGIFMVRSFWCYLGGNTILVDKIVGGCI
jgi:hypothetical protein